MHVTEFRGQGADSQSPIQLPLEPSVKTSSLTLNGTFQKVCVLSATTRILRIATGVGAVFRIAPDATDPPAGATVANSEVIFANSSIFRSVDGRQTLAVWARTSA
jgi:hypothetical protein